MALRNTRALLFLVLLPGSVRTQEVSAGPNSLGLPTVVARVNQRVIYRADVEARVAQVRSMDPGRFSRMGEEEQRKALGRLVNDLVIQALELDEAARRGVAASVEEVEGLFSAEARNFGGEQAFVAGLRQAGSTAGEWKRQMREVLSIRRIEKLSLGTSPAAGARAGWIAALRERARVRMWNPVAGQYR